MGLINNLPDQVLALIVAQFEDSAEMRAFSQTCRRLRAASGARLFSYIEIDGPEANERLMRVLRYRDKGGGVVTLHVKQWFAFGSNREAADDFVLPRLPNLRNLYISAGKGAVLVGDFFETAALEGRLQSLRTCTLSFSNHKYDYAAAQFEDFWKVFLLPGLENLTIFAATLDCWGHAAAKNPERHASNLRLIEEHRKTTALRKLHLWDCEMDLAALGGLLALPRRLEELVLHCNDPDNPENRTPVDEDTLLAALAPVSADLRRLTYIQDGVDAVPWRQGFPALEHLCVHPHPFFGFLGEATPDQLADAVPPNARTLSLACCRFTAGHGVPAASWIALADWLRDAPPDAHRLERIVLHPQDKHVPDRVVAAFDACPATLEIAEDYNVVRDRWRQESWPRKPPISWPIRKRDPPEALRE